MNNRTRKQHFVPRFYLESFTDAHGLLWTHDSKLGQLRQSLPESTGYETNIYSPTDEQGNRFDEIEELLAKIESLAAPILKDLKALKKLDISQKANFSSFLAATFVRSPSQIDQFASHFMEMTHWAASLRLEMENGKKREKGILSEVDSKLEEFLADKSKYEINVKKDVGLISFQLLETLANLMYDMTWTFEISENQELLTSDNSVFWVNGGPRNVPSLYGFGLAHKQAVIPFPISPEIVLRLDWVAMEQWKKHKLSKDRAKLANQYQAKHKARFLYFKSRDEGFCKLGMKYSEPSRLLSSEIESPRINVMRKMNSD